MNKSVKLEEGVKMKTKSYTYLLPLLCRELGIKEMLGLINVYMLHEDYQELDNHIFCLMEWSPNRVFTNFEQKLMDHPLCVKHEDVSSKHYIICFKVNESMQYNYDKFKEGKYSKLTMSFKEYLIDFFNLSKDHAVAMVLRKDPRLKKKYEEYLGVKLDNEAELSSIIDKDNETFKKSFIIESKSPLPTLSKF